MVTLFFRVFNEEAVKDYERFRKQEVRDLKEVLAAHIKTQMALCKLVGCSLLLSSDKTKRWPAKQEEKVVNKLQNF